MTTVLLKLLLTYTIKLRLYGVKGFIYFYLFVFVFCITECSDQTHPINNKIINHILSCFNDSLKIFHDILQHGAHWNQLIRILENFSPAFYIFTNEFPVSLLYDTVKMVTRVTKMCRCNKHKCVVEHSLNFGFVGGRD